MSARFCGARGDALLPSACAPAIVGADRGSFGLAHVGSDVSGFGVRFALELILGRKVLDTLEAGA